MQPLLTQELENLAKEKNKDITVIIAQAMKIGVSKLWQESILEKYLKGRLTRKQAIRILGIDLVKLADKQKRVVVEDIKWGLHA